MLTRVSKTFMKKFISATLLTVSIASCNQQEFYQKDFYEGLGVPDDLKNPTTSAPVDPNVGTTPDPTPSQPPVTQPPVVTTPPTTTQPPVVTTPPVSQPPVTGPAPSTPPTTGNTDDPTPVDHTGVCGTGTLVDAEDKFIQNIEREAKVDILWVVDDSGSMGDEQSALAYNFENFISEFLTRDIDFTLGITTTDTSKNRAGLSKGDLSKLTSSAAKQDEAQFISNFKKWIKVGTRGSGREKGLAGAKAFLDKHSTFVRDDAYLIVVFVSDEEDQSTGEVEQFLNDYKSRKQQQGQVKVYSIVTKEIVPNKKWETLGKRYVEASDKTGGTSSDIHQDFYTTLRDIGGKIVDLLDSFPLSSAPVTQDIKLTVNGVEKNDGWSYDSTSHVIKFDHGHVPNAGSISIAYYKKCDP